MNLPKEFPHRRFNPLSGQWLLVSPHRTQRPWQGQVERPAEPVRVAYDPQCYLCPGNPRAGGHQNPEYRDTFVFINDFAALLPDTPEFRVDEDGLFVAQSESGICKVVCFSPNHSLTLAHMSVEEIRIVVETWVNEYRETGSIPYINSVQIFENRGEMMGASNPHPHCQIWATESVPNELAQELVRFDQYWQDTGTSLLSSYLRRENEIGQRVVCQNDHFTAVVPFWAVWPFETLVIANKHVTALDQLDDQARTGLADILKKVTTGYDNLFETSFPYTMGFHQRPTDGGKHESFHFHAHFYPPLLRSATVRKFMVGFEMLGMPQRDITPEAAAERLRSLSEIHYSER